MGKGEREKEQGEGEREGKKGREREEGGGGRGRGKSLFPNLGKSFKGYVSPLSLNSHDMFPVFIMLPRYPQLNYRLLINFNIWTLTLTKSYVNGRLHDSSAQLDYKVLMERFLKIRLCIQCSA